jgi:hypothetical protein
MAEDTRVTALLSGHVLQAIRVLVDADKRSSGEPAADLLGAQEMFKQIEFKRALCLLVCADRAVETKS